MSGTDCYVLGNGSPIQEAEQELLAYLEGIMAAGRHCLVRARERSETGWAERAVICDVHEGPDGVWLAPVAVLVTDDLLDRLVGPDGQAVTRLPHA